MDYIAPEMKNGIKYNYSVDIWCVGILTYELIFGITPFKNNESILKFTGPISFQGADFIEKILV